MNTLGWKPFVGKKERAAMENDKALVWREFERRDWILRPETVRFEEELHKPLIADIRIDGAIGYAILEGSGLEVWAEKIGTWSIGTPLAAPVAVMLRATMTHSEVDRVFTSIATFEPDTGEFVPSLRHD